MRRARGWAILARMNPIAELHRRLDNLLRPGTIYAVDASQARCRVKSGELLTDWLPYFVHRAGSRRDVEHPTTGEQCLVLSPSGEMAAGLVLVGINADQFPAPHSNPALHSSHFSDGAWFGYDEGAHRMRFVNGPTEISADRTAISLVSNGSSIVINESGIFFNGLQVAHGGVNIGNTHKHPITGGSSAPGPTGGPQ